MFRTKQEEVAPLKFEEVENLNLLLNLRANANGVVNVTPAEESLAAIEGQDLVEQVNGTWQFTARYYSLVRRIEFMTEVETQHYRLVKNGRVLQEAYFTLVQLNNAQVQAYFAHGEQAKWEAVA